MSFTNYIRLYLTLFCFLIEISYASSQDKVVQVPIIQSKNFGESKGNSIDILGSNDVWDNNGKTDSILWTIDINISGKDSKIGLIQRKMYIVTSRIPNDSIKLEISRKRNPFIDKDVIFKYHADSLKKWTLKTVPFQSLKKVKLNFTFFNEAIENNYSLPWEAYIIPFSVGMTYNDSRLNEMPLAVKIGFNKVGKYGKDVIYASKRMSFNKPEFRIYREGKYSHEDKADNNIRYKEKYLLHDTVAIDGKFMRIDSVDADFSMIYMTDIKNYIGEQYISKDLCKNLEKYFHPSSKYLLLDFWGTWCVPCITSMPKMKLIFEDVRATSSFVGVCFDKADKFELAKEILNDRNISWPQIYVDMNQKTGSIVSEMQVSTFPTYIIIDRNGRIIFRDSSQGLFRLKDILLN